MWHPSSVPAPDRSQLQRKALRLEYATIGWNVGEAVLTIWLGIAAASLALIGFGADAIVEVFASLVVVWHIFPGHAVDQPARTARALRLVALSFALVAVSLLVASGRDLATGRHPGESPWGIAYLAANVGVEFGLARAKQRTAVGLDSAPLRSEATLTLFDAALAAGTTAGLAFNALLGWWWADPVAALLIAVAAANEARENWAEASSLQPPTR